VSDKEAIEQLRRDFGEGREVVVSHYIYFASRAAACLAAGELRDNGFEVTERLGADAVNWLVLARHRITPSEADVASLRTLMEALANAHGGDYDGWDAENPG